MTGEPPTDTDTGGTGLVTGTIGFGLWALGFGLWPLAFGQKYRQILVTDSSCGVSSPSMKFFTTFLFALICALTAAAQTTLIKPASADLIGATKKSKIAAEQELPKAEDAVTKATESLTLLQQLETEGLIARVDVESAEHDLLGAKTRVEELQKQIAGSIQLLADLRKPELTAQAGASKIKQLTKPTLMRISSSGSLIRATGGSWSMGNLSSVQQFFASTFGRPLPTSTIGQSATHNRLGWDHRHAVDVGLHPDSEEGRALIGFLESSNIPFLAFRSAIPGVATGPHIHIGTPSHRLG